MSKTVLELFERRVNESATRTALLYNESDEWVEQSWREWWEESERIAAGLIDLGVEPGEAVSILADTRPEWVWCDIGIAMAGGVVVPLYPSNLPEQCAYMLEDADVRTVIVEDPSQLDKIREVRDRVESLEHVIVIDRHALLDSPDWKGRENIRLSEVVDEESDWVCELDDVASSGRRRLAEDSSYVATRRRAIDPADPASIVYTSGTSGQPKGVVHTHGNFAAEIEALARLEILGADDRQLLFLPLAHIFAKVLYLATIGIGMETAFAESLDRVLVNLRDTEPTVVASVPRIFEKIHSQLVREAQRRPGLRRRMFELAFSRGRVHSRETRLNREPGPLAQVERRVYETFIYDRVKRLFGGRLRFLFSGGAPLRGDLAEFFHAAGVLILEGYGLTETAAVSTLNLPDDFRFGSVGKPIPGVDVTIGEDGEILVRGDVVMERYHGLPELTAEALEAEEGWFHTGDLGRFDRDGFLYITGRKKDLIVTAGGKNIAPRPIEEKLQRRRFVSGAIVYGDARPYLSALIAPGKEIEHWAAGKGIPFEDLEDLVEKPDVYDVFQEEVDAVNDDLPAHEAIRQFAIISRPFAAERGEVTPTGKLRRDAIVENHHELLDALYTPDE